MLSGRRIVLGVSGGIAAYKAIELCRRLVDAGAFVSPVLTPDALRFVTTTTFDALASEPARTSLWDGPEPSPHTTLGRAADLVVVAPATARTLAAYAVGLADDLLVATLLATTAPVVVAPAMHTEMWQHPATRDNVATLRSRGVRVVDPGEGHLAGGDVGLGRLADLDDIVAACTAALESVAGGTAALESVAGDLAGLSVLVTAGGTREPIDAVRVLTNRSSGKQGHALAAEAHARGASVTLVTTAELPVDDGVTVVRVDTAAEMEEAVVPRAAGADVVVMAAAVADFRPATVVDHKIKKSDGLTEIALEATHDFLVDIGRAKQPGQTIVGFAAETDDLRANAAAKLAAKHLDLVVGNDVSAPGVGFAHDTNSVIIVDSAGRESEIGLTDKRSVAGAIFDAVVTYRSTA